MSKQILFNEEARSALKRGVDKLAAAVRVTLGPVGRSVILDGPGTPIVTNDGVTVAKHLELKDKNENAGAKLLQEVASKTNDVAGDGTSTAVILAQAIIDEGLKYLIAGSNPLLIKKGIDTGVKRVIKLLKESAIPVSTKEEIRQVASVSANNETMGDIIAEAIELAGDNGVVTFEDSKSFSTEIETTDGMEFEKGFISPYMITNPDKVTAEYTDPYILITNQKISAITEILPIMEQMIKTGKKDLVIIADEIEGEALATFVLNRVRGVFNVLGIKAPSFGTFKEELIDDIAILTGGKVISGNLGMKLENVKLEDLGQARRVISSKENTIIVEGKGDKGKIKERVESIKKEMKIKGVELDPLILRLAKLSGSISVIKVGAATETEQIERKFKIEDAVNATKAAQEEGIVIGGGVALIRTLETLDDPMSFNGLEQDEKSGIKILSKALKQPLLQIAKNAGKVSGEVVIDTILKNKEKGFGYNAATGKFEDLIKAGIVDPVKVTRTALEKAASVATMFLITEAIITDEDDDEEKVIK